MDGLNSERASSLQGVKKIGVFRALQLGDLLCVMPAMRALRQAHPAAHITFIGLPTSRALIDRFHPYFDAFIDFPGYPGLPEQAFDALAFERFATRMRQEAFDLLLQLQGNGSIVNAMLASLGAKQLAGFANNEQELREPLMMPYPNFGHEINRHLRMMEWLGIPSKGTAIEFPLTADDFEAYESLLAPYLRPGKYLCIHPGSRGAWRQWPIEHFASLGNLCAARGLQIVITGTIAEMELAEKLASLLEKRPLMACGQTNLGTMALLLKNAFALLANCTGVSHLAAAIGTPSLIISMDGEAERWAPLNRQLHHTFDWRNGATYAEIECALEALLDQSGFAKPDQSPRQLDKAVSFDTNGRLQNG